MQREFFLRRFVSAVSCQRPPVLATEESNLDHQRRLYRLSTRDGCARQARTPDARAEETDSTKDSEPEIEDPGNENRPQVPPGLCLLAASARENWNQPID